MEVGRGEFGPARLAWTDASASAPLAVDVLARFGGPQLRRYAALEGKRARRFLAGRWLLATLLAESHGGADLRMTSACERCGADHGRPRLELLPVEVSVSYAGDMVAVAAVARADAPALGVDIEPQPSAGAHARLESLAPLFAPEPPPTTAEWTLLESAVKADGRGVAVDLSKVRLGAVTTGRLPASRAVRMPGRAGSLDAAVIAGPAGYVLSAAVAPVATALRAVRR